MLLFSGLLMMCGVLWGIFIPGCLWLAVIGVLLTTFCMIFEIGVE